jgi:hypothetical protein
MRRLHLLEVIQRRAGLSYIVGCCLALCILAIFGNALAAIFNAEQRVFLSHSAVSVSSIAGPVDVLRLMIVLCPWHVAENALVHVGRPQ